MSRKTLVSVAFVAAAASLGLFLSRTPWVAYREQKAKADAANKDMMKAESAKNELLERKAVVESPTGREQLARKLGYVKEGEKPLTTEPK
jgi:hypothetical protein